MKNRILAAALVLMAAALAAQAQEAGLIGKKASGAAKPAAANLRGLKNHNALPLDRLSQFANNPPVERPASTRGAKEASIYRRISPSVVLILVKNGDKSGLGSGTLVNANGDILTNWHVVRGATEVGVAFKPAQDGQQLTPSDIARGEVVRVDEMRDLALVRVKMVPPNRQPVKLGTPKEIGVGLDVFAIGHPEGEEWTYTKGIISQYRQAYQWTYADKSEHKANLIQTQTPINPGNSGGPLLSESGTLIGVNSFKAESGEGLNFAVALDEITDFLAGKSGHAPKKEQAQATADAKCQGKKLEEGRNKEDNASYEGFDTDCKGKINAVLWVPDDKNRRVTFYIDRNYDDKPDLWIVDYDRDKKWDLSFWDTKYSGKIDMVGLHPDGDLEPTSYMSYEAFKAKYSKEAKDVPGGQ